MITRKQIILLAAVLVAGVAGYFGWAAWRADRNLVTLDVRNMDVHEVVAKLRHQTWENIYADKNVQGKVTLRVRGVPLDEVLRMVGDQTSSRALVLFAVYSSGSSLSKLEESVRGEADPAKNGWTNLASAVGGPMGGPGVMMIGMGPGGNPFGAMADNSDQPVSLEIRGKELSFAALALQRFAQARVVAEDGANEVVTLALNKVPVGKAVAQLASKVSRHSTKIFVLQGMRGPGGPGGPGDGPRMVRMEGGNMIAQRGPGGPERPPDMTDVQRDEMRQKMMAQEQELRKALPAEERQKLEQQETEQRKRMEEIASLPPEEQRARMEQMMRANGGPNPSQMMKQRVLNTTPEQRSEMIRRQREMRQNGMWNPGGGGPGRGPGG